MSKLLHRLKTMAKSAVQQRLNQAGYEIVQRPVTRFLDDCGTTVVLDVGASVGGYGSDLRQHGYKGRIVSFEPLPDQFEKLKICSAARPPWTAVNCALGSKSGTAMIQRASNGDSSSMLPMLDRSMQAAPSIRPAGEVEVKVGRLDDIFSEHCGAADRVFLKMDVQGFEMEVLAGAEASLPRVCGIQSELSLVPLYAGAPCLEDVIRHLRAKGFHPVWFLNGFKDTKTNELLQVDGIFMRSA